MALHLVNIQFPNKCMERGRLILLPPYSPTLSLVSGILRLSNERGNRRIIGWMYGKLKVELKLKKCTHNKRNCAPVC